MSNRMWALSRPAVVALSVALSAGMALAQTQGQNPGMNNPNQSPGNSPNSMQNAQTMNQMNNMAMKCSMQDKHFLRAATQGSNFEIKAGQLAQSNGSGDDVKQFGQMMVTDHSKLNEDMMPVAQDAGMTPPKGLSAKDKAEYQKLAALHGQAFDNAYITTMLKDHKADLKAFKTEIADGQMQSEKQAAQQGESVIQMHLDKITQIAQAHNISTGGSMSGM